MIYRAIKTIVPLFVITIFFYITSCGTPTNDAIPKDLPASEIEKQTLFSELSTKEEILDSASRYYYQDTLWSASGSFIYQSKTDEITLGYEMRMHRGNKIWMSFRFFGFVVAKALLTPDRLSFYEKRGGKYYNGDYTFFQKKWGINVDYYKVEKMLLGLPMYDLISPSYELQTDTLYHMFSDTKTVDLPENHIVKLNKFTLKPTEQLIKYQLQESRIDAFVSYLYNEKKWEGGRVPTDIYLSVQGKDSKIKIHIDYDTSSDYLERRQVLRYPYRIPTGYSRISF